MHEPAWPGSTGIAGLVLLTIYGGIMSEFEYDIVLPRPPPIRRYKVKLNIRKRRKS
jgi:hypothetical protein